MTDEQIYASIVQAGARLLPIPAGEKKIDGRTCKGWPDKPADDKYFFTPEQACNRGEKNIAVGIPHGATHLRIIETDHAEAEAMVAASGINTIATWRTRGGGTARLIQIPDGFTLPKNIHVQREVKGDANIAGANSLNFSIRPQGQYQVAPCSKTATGDYTWLSCERATATPDQLNALSAKKADVLQARQKERRKATNAKRDRTKGGRALKTAGVAPDMIVKTGTEKKGARNNTLFNLALQMARLNFDKATIVAVLERINTTQFNPPYTEESAESIADRCIAKHAEVTGATESIKPVLFTACDSNKVQEAVNLFAALGYELRFNLLRVQKELHKIGDRDDNWVGALSEPYFDMLRITTGNYAFTAPEVRTIGDGYRVIAPKPIHKEIKKEGFIELVTKACMARAEHPILIRLRAIKDWGDKKWPNGIPEEDLVSAIFLAKCFRIAEGYEDIAEWCFPAMVRAMIYRAQHAAENRTFKYDSVLVLQGLSGTGKSELGKTIVRPFGDPRSYFTDSLKLDATPERQVSGMRGKILGEYSDTGRMGKGDQDSIKAFLASESDYVRLSFRYDNQDYIREIVLFMTADRERFLPLTADDIARRWNVIKHYKFSPQFNLPQSIAHVRKIGEQYMQQVVYEQILECAKGTPCHLPAELIRTNLLLARQHRVIEMEHEVEMLNLINSLHSDWGAQGYFTPEAYQLYLDPDGKKGGKKTNSWWLRERGFDVGYIKELNRAAWTFPDPDVWERLPDGDYVRRVEGIQPPHETPCPF